MDFNIRAMEKKDIHEVSEIYYEGFWGKFKPLHDMPENKAIELVQTTLFSNEKAFIPYYVALNEDKVVGILKIFDKDYKEDIESLSFSKVLEIGIIKVLKTGLLMIMLEEKAKPRELYIDTIAVSSKVRGMGVGSKLLDYAEMIVKKREDIDYLTLNVIEGNIGAKKLYERYGFETELTRKSGLLEKLSGVKEIYYMKKKIKN